MNKLASQYFKPMVRAGWFDQDKIVLSIVILLFMVFSLTLDSFLTSGNIMSLLLSVSILGILALSMGMLVIGGNLDLSLIAIMIISSGWGLVISGTGYPLWVGLSAALLLAILIGLVNGILTAYAEIPSIFTTLAMAIVVYGVGRLLLIPSDVIYVSDRDRWFTDLGQTLLLTVPIPVLIFIFLSLAVWLFLRRTRVGRYAYLMGDNYSAARLTGVPVRLLIVFQFILASVIAVVAGFVTAASVGSINTRIIINSTMIYDVILIVVIGGVGLSGGKGGVSNIIVGTLLIGILLNGLTIMDVNFNTQSLIKGAVLLFALMIDSLINPRDEQVGQQGDI